jgi:hypothetical protein
MEEEKLKRYKEFETDEFYVKDTIGIPHPYCIGTKHVVHASDNFVGRLTKEAIIDSEKHGAKCGICKGELSYEQHETAILIGCKTEDPKKLQAFCKSIIHLVEEDKYAGFSFYKDF